MIKKILFQSILFIALFNCKTTPEIITDPNTGKISFKDEINKRLSENYEKSNVVRVYFSTNRNAEGQKSCSDLYFTTKISEKNQYGFCDVNVPFLHDIGELDYDPKKGKDASFIFQSFLFDFEEDKWLEQVKSDTSNEIIVFVHGFNVKFEEAILRAAQIKYDLKFPGPILLYTWPAGADEGLMNKLLINDTYKDNYNKAVGSRENFQKYLSSVMKLNKKVHLIVHSMGHQVVLPSIDEMFKKEQKQIISELVLNAPDFESTQFAYISHNLKKSSDRITVYCSPGDNALVASSKVNSNKRIGSCEKIDGIDMINVNPIDAPLLGVGGLGHGYYSSRPVLTDLFQVIMGIDAKKRLFIRRSVDRNENYVLRR
jgi:esterase/lipase superfamily enzyme